MATRVFELSRELGVTSKVVLEKCRAEGLDIKNHMTTLSAGQEATVREWFTEGMNVSAVEFPEHVDVQAEKTRAKRSRYTHDGEAASLSEPNQSTPPQRDSEPKEQHFTIQEGAVGHSYASLVGPYLMGAHRVEVDDPWVEAHHQVVNFLRFCEAIVEHSSVDTIRLLTQCVDDPQLAKVRDDNLEAIRKSLAERGVVLIVETDRNLHDREIRIDNGWVLKIGRGLDFYHRPEYRFMVYGNDLTPRRCRQTKVDIYLHK